jgi:predicted GH43/DUF377 family glycosyl hydrolase
MQLKRFERNPILTPLPENPWENFSVCNPAVWYEKGRFYLLYRAAGDDNDHYIHFGLAESKDGFSFTRVSSHPVLSPSVDGPDAGCIEDPRIVKFGDWYYITYAYRPLPPGRYWENEASLAYMPENPPDAPRFYRENQTQSGLLMTKDFHNFHRLGRITHPADDNRDVILFPEKINGKYAMLHRSKRLAGGKYGCEHPSIWIAFSDDLLTWDDGTLLLKGSFPWTDKIGGASPPLLTDKGWLMLYHGVKDGVYRVGAALLDKKNPTRIISLPSGFIMEPECDYEINGLYGECVFPTGNVIVGDTLLVYYGAADKYCCVATCKVEEIINYLSNGS